MAECVAASYAPPCEISVLAAILTIANLTDTKRAPGGEPDVRLSRATRPQALRVRIEANAPTTQYRDLNDAMAPVHLARRA